MTYLENTTISGNAAALDGGGIEADGAATVKALNVTVAQNHADDLQQTGARGGGVRVEPNATVTIGNSLFAGNQRRVVSGLIVAYVAGDCSAQALISWGTNLIENAAGCANLQASDLKNVSARIAPLGSPARHRRLRVQVERLQAVTFATRPAC